VAIIVKKSLKLVIQILYSTAWYNSRSQSLG